MQDALPALVLNSEALPQHTMDETPASQTTPASPRAADATGASDERLMLAFSQGSSEAFTELFSRYKQPIYGFFRRRLAEPAHAEELTQETFLALLRAATRYQPRPVSHLSLRHRLQDTSRPSPQSRLPGRVFGPEKLRARSFQEGCHRVRLVGPPRC